MLAKSGGQNQTSQLFTKLLLSRGKALKQINFQPQPSFSNNLFKESKILKMSGFINYKYTPFLRNSLRKKNLQIFNDMFTLLRLNYTHNTHLFDIPHRQTAHSTASLHHKLGVTFKETPLKPS